LGVGFAADAPISALAQFARVEPAKPVTELMNVVASCWAISTSASAVITSFTRVRYKTMSKPKVDHDYDKGTQLAKCRAQSNVRLL
jgi:hypothetical protein